MSTMIRGATLIDGSGATTGDLLLTKDGIMPSLANPARTIEAPDLYVVPALIDCHDHLAFKGVLSVPDAEAGALMGDLMRSTDEARLDRELAAAGAEVLAAGVCTVRDFGVDLGAAQRAAADASRGPRIIASATPLGIPGGHLSHRARPVTTSHEVVDALSSEVPAPGISWIKLFASGGIANYPHAPISVELAADLMRIAVEWAHEHGLRAAAHCLPAESVANALAAGVDSIEHGVFLTEELAAQMAEQGTWYVPTLAGYARRLEGLRASGQTEAADAFERAVVIPHATSVRLAHEAGVRIAVGTDITASVVAEMTALVQVAGLDVDDVWWGATAGAAAMLGLTDGTGTLQEGARADVLVVADDPRTNLATLANPIAVIYGGVPVTGVDHE